MKYRSTRGGVSGVSFEEAVLTGYTPDGGILMPEWFPEITADKLKSWRHLSYTKLVKEIVPLFVDEAEIPSTDLVQLIDTAFSRFTNEDIAPIKSLKNGLNIHELFYGATLAFKDLAMSCLGQFLNYFLEKRKIHYTVLVATSGDTGSSAIEAVRGSKWIDIVVFLPMGRCSKIQELQMTTVHERNVHVYRVDGTSDDLDVPIKSCFTDTEFVKKHHLTSINSINWARIMVQIVSYFYGYLQLCPECDKEVEIIIPTGACGNVTGGCIAKKMGLPVRFVCAVTINNIVARTIDSGDFSVDSTVVQTLAPAMDIQCPYNMERIWYVFLDCDTNFISELLQEFEREKKLQVPDELLKKIKLVLNSYTATDEDVKNAMRRCWEENNYLVCPHTATAVSYYYHNMSKNKADDVPRLCIATASPAKFTEAVVSAGLTPQKNEKTDALETMATHYIDLERDDDWLDVLKKKIESIAEDFKLRE